MHIRGGGESFSVTVSGPFHCIMKNGERVKVGEGRREIALA